MKLDGTHLTILAIVRQADICPSYREIADKIGMSFGGTRDRIYALVRNGYLAKKHGATRSLAITDKGLEVLPELIVVDEITRDDGFISAVLPDFSGDV